MLVVFCSLLAALGRRGGSGGEPGQSVIEYLIVIVGVATIAAVVVGAIAMAVNGKLPELRL